jgi:hypothetical protein
LRPIRKVPALATWPSADSTSRRPAGRATCSTDKVNALIEKFLAAL